MTVRLVFLLTVAATLASAGDCVAQRSLAPDLSIDYTCAGAPPADKKIETFLKARGFEVENPERMRSQLGVGFFPMDIEAIDARRWAVEFRGRNEFPSPVSSARTRYTVAVYSPPPTAHDTALEAALLALVARQQGCKIISSRRAQNAQADAGMFDFVIATLRGRMHDVAICDQTEPTYNDKACNAVPGVKELKARQP